MKSINTLIILYSISPFISYASESRINIWIAENKNEFSYGIHSLLLEHIPDTKKFDLRLYEYGRALADFKSIKPTCLFNRRVSSIFKDASYSIAVTTYQSRELFFRTGMSHNTDKIKDDSGIVSLAKIFENYPDRVLMIGEGLTYGDKLDAEIKKIPVHNLYVRAPSGHAGAYINMLEKERIDYLIEYPISFKSSKKLGEKFSSFKISESIFINGHLVCNKATPPEAIKTYNKAITASEKKIKEMHIEFGFKIY